MRWSRSIAAAVIAAAGTTAAAAGGALDHERARQAYSEGRIVSLQAILRAVASEHAGELLEVHLEEEERGNFVYGVKLLTPEGRILEAYYDARTGERMQQEREGRTPD